MYYSGITLLKETDDIAKISLYLCFVATHALGHMMYGCIVVRLYIYNLSFKEIKQNFMFSYNTFI